MLLFYFLQPAFFICSCSDGNNNEVDVVYKQGIIACTHALREPRKS